LYLFLCIVSLSSHCISFFALLFLCIVSLSSYYSFFALYLFLCITLSSHSEYPFSTLELLLYNQCFYIFYHTTKFTHQMVYSIQHYVIKFVSHII
jgi:hypothetical protein